MPRKTALQEIIDSYDKIKSEFDSGKYNEYSKEELDAIIIELGRLEQQAVDPNFAIHEKRLMGFDSFAFQDKVLSLEREIDKLKKDTEWVDPVIDPVGPVYGGPTRSPDQVELIENAEKKYAEFEMIIRSTLHNMDQTELYNLVEKVKGQKDKLDALTDSQAEVLKISFDFQIKRIFEVIDDNKRRQKYFKSRPIYYRTSDMPEKVFNKNLIEFISLKNGERIYFGSDNSLYVSNVASITPDVIKKWKNDVIRTVNWENIEYKYQYLGLSFNSSKTGTFGEGAWILADDPYTKVDTIKIIDATLGKIEIGLLADELKIGDDGKIININYSIYDHVTNDRIIGDTIRLVTIWGLSGLAVTVSFITVILTGRKVYRKFRS